MITLTEEEYTVLCDEYMGICLECHAERECCEPDAIKYQCENCGAFAVYGAEELLLMGELELT